MKIKSHSKLQNPFCHYVHLQNWTIWEKWIEKNPPKFNLFLKSLEANYHSDIWTILLHIPICMNEIPSSMYEYMHIDSKLIPNLFKQLNSFHSFAHWHWQWNRIVLHIVIFKCCRYNYLKLSLLDNHANLTPLNT